MLFSLPAVYHQRMSPQKKIDTTAKRVYANSIYNKKGLSQNENDFILGYGKRKEVLILKAGRKGERNHENLHNAS